MADDLDALGRQADLFVRFPQGAFVDPLTRVELSSWECHFASMSTEVAGSHGQHYASLPIFFEARHQDSRRRRRYRRASKRTRELLHLLGRGGGVSGTIPAGHSVENSVEAD
jgi:hypothetical protein